MIDARLSAGCASGNTSAPNPLARLLALGRPLVMGVLNVTPDSFFPASRTLALSFGLADTSSGVDRAARSADAPSSREGAAPAPAKIRVLPFFKASLLSWRPMVGPGDPANQPGEAAFWN